MTWKKKPGKKNIMNPFSRDLNVLKETARNTDKYMQVIENNGKK